jgi:dihydroxy-acid dehydratase
VVKDGDLIEIDLSGHRLDLKVPLEEIQKRLTHNRKRPNHPAQGILQAYRERVAGADEGAIWL